MRRVVSVWLPTLPTDRLRRHTASSPPEAPLITAFHDGRRQSLAAVDAAARKLGLYPGMPLAHAQAMIPGLNVVPADPANDAATLARLVVGCLRYSPLTAPDPPDGIWIDATGCTHLFGGEEALLADLVTRLQRSGFAARAAIADTTGAAWSFAHYGEMPVTVVPAGEAAQSIANLPIAALRLASDLTEALGRLGIERIGQIMAEPRAPFARRFGPELLHRLDQATGREFEPVNPVFPADSISKRLAFAEPLLTPQAFTGVIDRLTKQVCTELERKRQGARTLDLLFERVDGSIEAVRIGTAQPNRHPKHLARLLQERLDRVDPGLGVDAMRLIASLAEPLAYTQIRAGVGGAEADANISLLVDRLANRLGAGRVYRVAPVESHVPERSIRRVAPLAPVRADRDQVESRRRSTSRESARSQNLERFHLGGNRSRARWLEAKSSESLNRALKKKTLDPDDFDLKSSSSSSKTWPADLPRPARLLARPQPIDAVSLLPDHPPAAFTWRRVRHRVRRADGPERITGEWWKSDSEMLAVRDYWAVEDEQGRRFWLFRSGDGADPKTGDLRWFLHGLF